MASVSKAPVPTGSQIKTMAESLPRKFISIKDFLNAKHSDYYNVIGYVVDYMPPAPTRGDDLISTLVLSDNLNGFEDGRLTVKVFKKTVDAHPPVHSTGDVVIARSLQMSQFRSQAVGMLKMTTILFVFYTDDLKEENRLRVGTGQDCSLKHWKSSSLAKPEAHEAHWAITLGSRCAIQRIPTMARDSKLATQQPTQHTDPLHQPGKPTTNHESQPVAAQPAAPSRRDKFSLIKGISNGNFYDLTVEVVKIFHQPEYLELYATDWTANANLRVYEPNEGTAPAGQYTLKIEVLPPHSHWVAANASNANASTAHNSGALLNLHNVRIKWSKSGQELEGNMWPDSRNSSKVQVSHASPLAEKTANLNNRRDAYMKEHYNHSTTDRQRATAANPATAPHSLHVKASKRNLSGGTAEELETEPQRLSKSQRKRRRQRRKQQQHDEDVQDNDEAGSKSGGAVDVIARESDDWRTPGLNPDIHVDNSHLPLSTIDVLLNNPRRRITTPSTNLKQPIPIPFVNVSHLLCLKVVDYYPHDILDFSSKAHIPEDTTSTVDTLEPDTDTQDQQGTESGHWHWEFWLVVVAGGNTQEPAKNVPVKIHVFEQEGEYLLGIPACNLRQSPTTLAHLRSKLWTLWGDLEERKTAFLRENPGVQADGGFSLLNYGVGADNRGFLGQVREFGLPLVDEGGPGGGEVEDMSVESESVDEGRENDGRKEGERSVEGLSVKENEWNNHEDDNPFHRWKRFYRLFGTRISADRSSVA
ncbi:MAG: hypothetical protein M1831_004762 [Alyxoria varia]|nr:MAG: hypothetical protein M1831_004762 [Alyxoria varia]